MTSATATGVDVTWLAPSGPYTDRTHCVSVPPPPPSTGGVEPPSASSRKSSDPSQESLLTEGRCAESRRDVLAGRPGPARESTPDCPGSYLQVPLPVSLYCSAVESKPGPGRTGL